MQLNSVVFACQENAKGNALGGFVSEQDWAETDEGAQFAMIADGSAVDASAANDADLQLLEGAQKVHSIAWGTSFVDGAVPVGSTSPTSGDYLGGLSLANDWIAGWTYGIEESNRAQALWFE